MGAGRNCEAQLLIFETPLPVEVMELVPPSFKRTPVKTPSGKAKNGVAGPAWAEAALVAVAFKASTT